MLRAEVIKILKTIPLALEKLCNSLSSNLGEGPQELSDKKWWKMQKEFKKIEKFANVFENCW